MSRLLISGSTLAGVAAGLSDGLTGSPHAPPPDFHAPPPGPSHRVQFYEDESFLAHAVADFLATGLSIGQPAIVIATAA